jgi:hypothetical protein
MTSSEAIAELNKDVIKLKYKLEAANSVIDELQAINE